MRRRPDTFMPMYWGDYLRDTSHLSAAEHGGYLLLIGHYWTTGAPLPADDGKLARIARMTAAEWKKARATIADFFQVTAAQWNHRRIDSEMEKAAGRYAERVLGAEIANAKRRAKRTAEHDAEAIAQGAVPTGASPSPSHSPVGESVSQVSRETFDTGSVAARDRFWNACPKRGQHANPRQPALQLFDEAVKRGVDPEMLIRAAAAWARADAGKDPEKVAQVRTWLAEQRWEQYDAPEMTAATPDEKWRERLAQYRGKTWPKFFGPAPGEPGCKIPPHVLAELPLGAEA